MALLEAEALRVGFPLYHLAARSLKKRLLARTAARVRTDEANRVVVCALRDLNFRIESRERVALIGRNGAGKTTLLRSLAGIYEPVGGRLRIEGSLGSMIDPAAGMDQDSTGRENVRLRALYRSLGPADQAVPEEEVAEFAGLGEFTDVPIKGYSAGMSIRLAIAIATAMQPQILLMDEWFMAGDAAFMGKAEARLAQLVSGADILVIASHDMDIVRRWCTRAIRLDSGRIVADGPPDQIIGEMLAEPD